jgi:hypothetical protein
VIGERLREDKRELYILPHGTEKAPWKEKTSFI